MTEPRDDDPMAAVRPYIEMAAGVLGISAAKAAEMAQGLWSQGGDVVDSGVRTVTQTGEQVSALLSPEQVRQLVRDEVERVVRRLGFAREDEVASLRREVGRLEKQVTSLGARLDGLAAQVTSKGGKRNGAKGKGGKDKGAKGKKHASEGDGS